MRLSTRHDGRSESEPHYLRGYNISFGSWRSSVKLVGDRSETACGHARIINYPGYRSFRHAGLWSCGRAACSSHILSHAERDSVGSKCLLAATDRVHGTADVL